MAITFTAGTKVPADGEYAAVDDEERPLGRTLPLRRGACFPPTMPGENGYVLIEAADAGSAFG